MSKSVDKLNCVNKIRTFKKENVAHGKTGVRFRPPQTNTKQLYHLDSNCLLRFVSLHCNCGDSHWSARGIVQK